MSIVLGGYERGAVQPAAKSKHQANFGFQFPGMERDRQTLGFERGALGRDHVEIGRAPSR